MRASHSTRVPPNFETHTRAASYLRIFALITTCGGCTNRESVKKEFLSKGHTYFSPFLAYFFLSFFSLYYFFFFFREFVRARTPSAISRARFIFPADCTEPPLVPSSSPKPVHRHYGARGNEVATRRFQGSRTGVRLIPPVTSDGAEG